MSAELDQLAELFNEILQGAPILPGSVTEGNRVCGKKGCKCERGELHPRRMVYGRYEGGKYRSTTIPQEERQELLEAVERYRLLLGLLGERANRFISKFGC